MSHILPSGFRAGEMVRARGEVWTVRGVTSSSNGSALDLVGLGSTNRQTVRTLLIPFDRPQTISRRTRCRVVSRRAWMRALRHLLVTSPAYERLRAPATARLDLLPYQLEPAIVVSRAMATRLLLADEVGLGKTIQAALVLSELRAREERTRALILTPAGLCDQWANELAERFGIESAIVDTRYLRSRGAELPPDVNPWAIPSVVISSIDLVKRPDTFASVEPIVWDLLIVDEAHLAAVTSDRRAAADALGRRARHVLLLTATPHSGDSAAFESLCRIGAFDRDGPILMFRRSRRDVGLPASRHTLLLPVRLTPAEAHVHRLLRAYVDRVRTEASDRRDHHALLAMCVLIKRAFSSPASLARTAARRLAALDPEAAEPAAQMLLPFDPTEMDDRDAEPVAGLEAPGLADRVRERALLEELVRAAVEASRHESKLAVLVRFLRRAREPAIVFTEYRDTLEQIVEALGPIASVTRLHGRMTKPERREALAAFTGGRARVLIATDAAGEGLNLHATCRLVINLELPWNPIRLEQRIGRVDRIGQTRAVHAVHLFAAGTAETDVLARLVARLDRARRSLGSIPETIARLREQDLADLVLAGSPDPSVGSAFTGSDAPQLPKLVGSREAFRLAQEEFDLADAADDEASHARWIRALISGPAHGSCQVDAEFRCGTGPHLFAEAHATLATVLSNRQRLDLSMHSRGVAHGLVARFPEFCCLYRVRLFNKRGQLLEPLLVVLSVAAHLPRLGRRRDVARAIDDLLAPIKSDLAERARRVASERTATVQQAHEHVVSEMYARETAMLSLAERGVKVAGDLVQAGLFDRRALREARNARARWERTRSMAAARLAFLDSSLEITAEDPELVLVLASPHE